MLWSRDIGFGYSNVVTQGNRLYTMGLYEGTFACFCLNADTGRPVWQRFFPSSDAIPQSTPAVDGDRVYGLDKWGLLFCLGTRNGEVLWQKDLQKDLGVPVPNFGWATSPVVDGDLLLLNANTAEMALDKRTGDLKWTVADKNPDGSCGSYATPVLGDFKGTRCAVFFGPSTLNAVDVRTGEKLWWYSHAERGLLTADPIVQGNTVFIQAESSCTLLETGEAVPRELWSNAELDTYLPAAVLVKEYLFGTHCPGSQANHASWGSFAQDGWPLR